MSAGSHISSARVRDLARLHDLQPHPEGGWYKRTWTAPTRVETARGSRATASAIIFLLDQDEEAAWHVVLSDELWLWHGPGRLEIHRGGTGDFPQKDPDPVVLSGEDGNLQVLIPAGTWQRTFARDDVTFATCIVSPEFSFDDWTLAHSADK
ncbi:cupin domain-containing protein [Schaalia sp. lx-260]|uniref:cupin domain-containing protein n=1 Tax=Schaalia sp. lx-260 TaxID=2899082 RepID=UPI001E576E3B|nr:cupin domain-containing protein [Schaalia sp. lx-260]MCD4550037.1 cupin domain-containing protein [Schaalia sp. lx-260]